MDSVEREKLARQRFMTMNVMRLVAVGIVAMGLANIAEKFMPEISPQLGYAFLVVGAVDFFLAPWLLKKAWAKQDSGTL